MAQRGNILFLILLAVVLFAALSYAVTSSMRGGGKDVSDETAQTGAAAIAQYVTLLRNEVQRLMMMNGCTAANLDWRHNYYKRYDGTNTGVTGTTAPSPKMGCAVFQAYGGPVSPIDFEKYNNPGYVNAATSGDWRAGHAAFRWGNFKNAGTAANDVVIVMNGVDAKVCAALLKTGSVSALSATEYWNNTVDANNAQPADYTADADIVNEAINLEDFAVRRSVSSAGSWCIIASVIVPQ